VRQLPPRHRRQRCFRDGVPVNAGRAWLCFSETVVATEGRGGGGVARREFPAPAASGMRGGIANHHGLPMTIQPISAISTPSCEEPESFPC
jgi:hypothetical protein